MRVGWQLATERGHSPIRLEAKPSFGNLILWKVIYEIEEGFYTDGVRIGFKTKIYPGKLIPKLNMAKGLSLARSQLTTSERFKTLSHGSRMVTYPLITTVLPE